MVRLIDFILTFFFSLNLWQKSALVLVSSFNRNVLKSIVGKMHLKFVQHAKKKLLSHTALCKGFGRLGMSVIHL